MKIVQAVHSFPPRIGGVERHAYELCKNLASMGNSVTVHTSGGGKGSGAANPSQKPAPAKEGAGRFLIKRHWGLRFPFFSSVVVVPFLALRLIAEDADIYVSHGYGSLMPFCTAVAAILKRKPFVFTVHGYPRLSGMGRIALWIYRNTIARVVLGAASKIIVVSRESKKYLVGETNMGKVIYIPNGVDTKAFSCPSFREGEYISYVGRLDKDKQVGMLINAVSRMKQKARVLIAGNDEGQRPGLIEHAKNRRVDAEFTEVEPEEAPSIYCYSKAIVLPSRYEGFSLVWLEAMSCGRPIFSTPVGQAPELFREAYGEHAEKFLFPDERGLTERLDYFVENEKEFVPIVKKARELVEKEYSWVRMSEKTLAVYESALGIGKEDKKE
ncbi:glycosyltransferase family 4 protein [Candidatus Micrarchaeota archaeon]|nr:glycosyltransferase family 4 protein [Candidatus Micrarchaeota archaeon]